MVKRQREKQYQSARENREYSQIRSGRSTTAAAGTVQRRLPFSHCALTLTAYETPVCNLQGVVFENTALLPFLMKHKIDPVTGQPMSSRDVITLNMDKDEQGRWQCPIMNKPFMDHTKIIAILQPNSMNNEANVYSYEAYHELNVKAKNYQDLISGVAFDKKKHVLLLNDPNDEELNQRRDINQFYHIRHARELKGNDDDKQGGNTNVRYSVTATRIMDQLKKQGSAAETKTKQILLSNNEDAAQKDAAAAAAAAVTLETTTILVDGERVPILSTDVTGVQLTSNKAAGSFTSTAHELTSANIERTATLEEVLQSQFKVMRGRQHRQRKLPNHTKGLVRMQTSLGNLVLELHCDIVPRTCTNFLGLCRAGAYDGTIFHRLIKSFMIQGGGYSKLGKKKNEEEETSLWGNAFVDEFDDRLKHSGGGILSMANAGPNTNKRQFFITFKSCGHLDRKHSVFGKVVEGMDVLHKMEQVPTDKKDRPTSEIKIIQMDILKDPAKEARELEEQRIAELVRVRRQAETAQKHGGAQKPVAAKAATTNYSDDPSVNEVGRFLKDRLKKSSTSAASASTKGSTEDQKPSRLPPPPKRTKFTNFSGW